MQLCNIMRFKLFDNTDKNIFVVNSHSLFYFDDKNHYN